MIFYPRSGFKPTAKMCGEVIEALLSAPGIVRATKYAHELETIKATRRTFRRAKGKPFSEEIIVTVGRPNYAERAFIKQCKKAGEPFPVKKIQLKLKPSAAKAKAA